MREILFRGKRIDNGEWVEGYYVFARDFLIDEMRAFIINGDCFPYSEFSGANDVSPVTVGQYTGLTDKNGKKIFEGDILRFGLLYDYECYLESLERPDAYDGEVYDQDIEVAVVEWCIDYDYPAFDLKDHQFECNGLAQLMCGGYEYEVIGNIHDNPELLKGDADNE